MSKANLTIKPSYTSMVDSLKKDTLKCVHLDNQDTCPICISVHTFRSLKSGHLTNKDTLIIRTLVHGPICISVHTFRPLKSGHLTNKDTLIIRTLDQFSSYVFSHMACLVAVTENRYF